MEIKKNNLFFDKVDELKKITLNQKKTILSGDIDIFVSLERFRVKLREEIDKIRETAAFNMQEYKKYMSILSEMEKIEKKNRELLMEWSKDLKKEDKNIRKIKKVSAAYFNKNKLPVRPGLINKIT